MPYTSFAFMFPPRPEVNTDPILLDRFEGEWLAQVKKNGTNNVMDVTADRRIIARTRHKNINDGQHTMWKPDARTAAPFRKLKGGWFKFSAELLHNKCASGPRHTNYIHDILVCDGEILVGTTFIERQAILARLFPDAIPHASGGYSIIDAHTWLATNYTTGFWDLLRALRDPEDEGLVLKKADARLAYCFKKSSNSHWLMKCLA